MRKVIVTIGREFGSGGREIGLKLSENGRGNVNLSADRKSQTGYGKLTEEDKKNNPDKDERQNLIRLGRCAKGHPHENSKLRGDNHKLVREGVDKLTELRNKIASASDLPVKHIG